MNINIKTYVVFFILVFALSACKTTSGTKWIEIDQEPLTDNEKTEFTIIVEKRIVQKMKLTPIEEQRLCPFQLNVLLMFLTIPKVK